jgi:FAD/FMN-containing dehydrogenase
MSVAGIPVLLPTQPGFKDAIKTWSAHQQPTKDDLPRAVFRPETEADVSRIVNWAREGGIKVTPKSGGLGGACGRGGISMDMGAFNKYVIFGKNLAKPT